MKGQHPLASLHSGGSDFPTYKHTVQHAAYKGVENTLVHTGSKLSRSARGGKPTRCGREAGTFLC